MISRVLRYGLYQKVNLIVNMRMCRCHYPQGEFLLLLGMILWIFSIIFSLESTPMGSFVEFTKSRNGSIGVGKIMKPEFISGLIIFNGS